MPSVDLKEKLTKHCLVSRKYLLYYFDFSWQFYWIHSWRNLGIDCFCYSSLTNFHWSSTNFIPLISQLVYLSLWSYLSHSIGSFCSSKQGLILEDIIINSHFIGITSEIFSMVLMVPASLWRYLCTVIFISIYYAMYRPSDC